MKKLLLSAAIVALVPSAAMAQSAGYKVQAGDILVHGRLLDVVPSEKANTSGALHINDALSISNHVVPEIDLTYFLTNNLGVEVIAGVTPHDVTGKKGAVAGLDFGRVWLLPPTVTLKYQFDPIAAAGGISPYVGAGINYTKFFNSGKWNKAVISDVSYDSSWGGALQAGVDVPLTGNWTLNADVKKVWINSNVDVKLVGGAHVYSDTDINPWIVGLGVGYKF